MSSIDWSPSRSKLALFSRIGALILFVFGVFSAWKHGNWPLSAGLWAAAGVVLLSGVLCPLVLKPVFLCLTVLTFPIGWAISHLVLAAVFFLLFTPMALWFRMIRRDALRLRPASSRTSCWIPYPEKPLSPVSYYRPF